uniref:DUF19 domain-containing protein n=1 Tax=Parascaris univalens TaxID=6257 RepID=A0A915CA64_PARUN
MMNLLVAINSFLLFTSLPMTGMSAYSKLRPPQLSFVSTLREISLAAKSQLQPISCTADDEMLFIGCLNDFLSNFNLTMTNGKLPDTTEAVAILNEDVQCRPYDALMECNTTSNCMYINTFEKYMKSDYDISIYETIVMYYHVMCTNKEVDSLRTCLEKMQNDGTLLQCVNVFPTYMPCSETLSILSCVKLSTGNVCGKELFEPICVEQAYDLKFQQLIDTNCYNEVMDYCSRAQSFAFNISLFFALFIIILII